MSSPLPFHDWIIGLTSFCLQDVSKISVTNLQNKAYIDKVDNKQEKQETSNEITITGETDRVYLDVDTTSPVAITENGQPLFTISHEGLNTVTLWNPWVENAKKMSDFGDDEYKYMICVEPGAVKNWQVLEGGDAWEGTQTIRPRL